MASSHKTEHYGLSQFAPLDRPAWLVDYNTDMEKIDTALHNLDETGGGGGTLDQTARDMTQAAQDAAKDAQGMATAAQATADKALEKAEEALNQQGTITGDITNINEEITQIKNDVNTAQSTATTANETAEEALELAQGCVKRSGDTMTGPLKLAGNPVDDADAANKGYVDSVAGNPFPDVPFTDDRWKLAGAITHDNWSGVELSFGRLPRELLVVVNGTWGADDNVQISFQPDKTGDALIEFDTDTPAPVPFLFPLHKWVMDYNKRNFVCEIDAQGSPTQEFAISKAYKTLAYLNNGNFTGDIKVYWR